jgi:hypothetical protein
MMVFVAIVGLLGASTGSVAAAEPASDACDTINSASKNVNAACGVDASDANPNDGDVVVEGFAAAGADATVAGNQVGAGAGTNNTVGYINGVIFQAVFFSGDDTEAGGEAPVVGGFGAGAGYGGFASTFFGGAGAGAGAGTDATGGAGAGCGVGYPDGIVPTCNFSQNVTDNVPA